MGLKNLAAWNKASIAKLVWCVALKKDILWVKWVHGNYFKQQDWWDYHAPSNCSWHWKKIVKNKEVFKQGVPQKASWAWQDKSDYTIRDGYYWLFGRVESKD